MIKEIIEREWDFFQDVKNIGGRANCQNDFETFYLQRHGQFEILGDEFNESYLQDLKNAKETLRNPITEKYGYMMESTDPQYYASIKDQLPKRSDEQMAMINAICAIEVGMREEFNEQYPKLSNQARYTHTSEDDINHTSFETYLRGELSTYSMSSLVIYGRRLTQLINEGKNMVAMIQECTVKGYGYTSLDDVESKL